MQSVVDYLRANSPHHAADTLNAQLLQAGHAPETVRAAWSHVTAQSTAAVAVREPVMGGGPTAFDNDFQHRSTVIVLLAVIAVFAVATIAIGVSGGGIKLGIGDTRADSTKEAFDMIPKEQLTDEERALATQALKDADVEIDLPRGWSQVDKGAWRDASTGNNVLVMTFDAPGATLDQATPSLLAQLKADKAVVIRKGPIDAKLDGMRAKRIYYTLDMGDTVIDGSQWYAVTEGKVHVVTGTLMPAGRNDADEVTQVVDSLQFG